MTIKEITISAAGYLGREDIIEYLENHTFESGEETRLKKEINILNRCANLTINRLATEYVPIKTIESVRSVNGKITYASLQNNVLDVLSVYDYYDNKISFRLYPLYIKTKPEAVKIEYTFIPVKYEADQNIAYSEKDVPARVIAYGVAAEWCMISGDYDEGRIWDKRFKESAENVSVARNRVVKARSWI